MIYTISGKSGPFTAIEIQRQAILANARIPYESQSAQDSNSEDEDEDEDEQMEHKYNVAIAEAEARRLEAAIAEAEEARKYNAAIAEAEEAHMEARKEARKEARNARAAMQATIAVVVAVAPRELVQKPKMGMFKKHQLKQAAVKRKQARVMAAFASR
jgi:hypothetical protein